MTDFDPTDPWGTRSPWAPDDPETTTTSPEPPMTNTPAAVATSPNPFKIGFTLKAAAGYDAEWLTPTVYGSTAEETAQRGKDLLLAMRQVGLIELTAQAADYARGQFRGGKHAKPAPASKPSFQNGQVQYGNQSPSEPDRPANVPPHYVYKEGIGKTGRPYKGWVAPRGVEGDPIWL